VEPVVASLTLAFVIAILLLPIRSHKRFFPAAEISGRVEQVATCSTF
jgi:hypothetical protein